MNRLINYVKEIWNEMKKVAWPTRNELVNSTIVVIVISALMAVVIFVLDTIFSSALSLVVK